MAEFAASYLKNGRLLYVEGRLHWSSWQAADGSPRRGCEVRAGNLQVLDQRPEPSEQPEGGGPVMAPLYPEGRLPKIRSCSCRIRYRSELSSTSTSAQVSGWSRFTAFRSRPE